MYHMQIIRCVLVRPHTERILLTNIQHGHICVLQRRIRVHFTIQKSTCLHKIHAYDLESLERLLTVLWARVHTQSTNFSNNRTA